MVKKTRKKVVFVKQMENVKRDTERKWKNVVSPLYLQEIIKCIKEIEYNFLHPRFVYPRRAIGVCSLWTLNPSVRRLQLAVPPKRRRIGPRLDFSVSTLSAHFPLCQAHSLFLSHKPILSSLLFSSPRDDGVLPTKNLYIISDQFWSSNNFF